MRKLILFAAIAGLGLVSASPPEGDHGDPAPRERRTGYPPCSRTVTDSCIQGSERRVHGATHARRVRMAGERG